jgi:uncharacterized protein YndB with AHSA1/START domain
MTTRNSTRPTPRRETIYSTPSDRELVITRTFDAPRSLVWTAFTDPKHIPNWQTGPAGFTMPVCEIDLRPGGTWHYVWRNPTGREFGATGTYREVDPPNRLVHATTFNDEENTSTTTFTEEDGRTTVTVSMLFASKESRDQGLPYAKVGTDVNHARLDEYLAAIQ